MTSQEARQQIEKCEDQIRDAYYNLRIAAKNVGTRGYQTVSDRRKKILSDASDKMKKGTRFPLLLLLSGFIFCLVSPLLGIFCIFGGVILVVIYWNDGIKDEEKIEKQTELELNQVSAQKGNLNTIVDNNPQI